MSQGLIEVEDFLLTPRSTHPTDPSLVSELSICNFVFDKENLGDLPRL